MTVLRQTTTKKGKARYWVDFVSDRRHQRKFQIFEDACAYLYLNWFCYKINNRSVNDDAVFDSANLKEMMQKGMDVAEPVWIIGFPEKVTLKLKT